MDETRSVLEVKNCGHIEIRLQEMLTRRNITRNALARAINARFEVVDKWYKGNVEKLDMDVLARMCFVLNCRVEDILRYVEE